MKIIFAFDSFKGCLSASEACRAAADGLRLRYPDADLFCLPMSDGGEGLVDCITGAIPVRKCSVRVHDPLMQWHEARFAISEHGDTAYMEMAEASGLTLVPAEKRNPLDTTTRGVGEMILEAVRLGCKKIVLGIGGSATCDGGQGMIDVLRPHLPLPVEILVASDVSNPLYGPNGAAYVFAPQKGATPEQVRFLDKRLRDFAHETELAGYAAPELAEASGAGAAGGLGYGLMAYLGAKLTSGIDLLLDIIGFDTFAKDANYILTGEGKSDKQTLMGKVPFGILKRASKTKAKTLLISGAIEDRGLLLNAGFDQVISINEGDGRPLSMLLKKEIAIENLSRTCRELILTETKKLCPDNFCQESEYDKFCRMQLEQFEDDITEGRCYPEMPEGQFVRSK